jgi:hypothetical protein
MNLFTKFICQNIKISLLILSIGIIIHCERFTGYKYDADEVSLIAEVAGKVTNVFTEKPIYQAKVSIGSITTQTDENGEYIIYYKLDENENRDKPVWITISSPNYQVYIDSLILYPTKATLDVELIYASPIIQKQILYEWFRLKPIPKDSSNYDTLYVCQALIFDYQGESDIYQVKVDFVYHDVILNLPRFETIIMEYAQKQSDNAAYFHGYANKINRTDWLFQYKCSIKAYDKSGHSGSSLVTSTSIKDSLLIPLEY